MLDQAACGRSGPERIVLRRIRICFARRVKILSRNVHTIIHLRQVNRWSAVVCAMPYLTDHQVRKCRSDTTNLDQQNPRCLMGFSRAQFLQTHRMRP